MVERRMRTYFMNVLFFGFFFVFGNIRFEIACRGSRPKCREPLHCCNPPHSASDCTKSREYDIDEDEMSQKRTACPSVQAFLDMRKQVCRTTSWAFRIRDEVRLFVCEPPVLQHLRCSRALVRISRQTCADKISCSIGHILPILLCSPWLSYDA